MTPRALVVPFVLPVVFAAVVLAATAANGRDGRGPTRLTEREAVLAPRTGDRSIAEVWLGWTEPAGLPGAWLTPDALGALGFDVGVEASDPRAEAHYRRQLWRRAFVAFELAGPAWEAALADRKPPAGPDRAALEGGRDDGSRLVPVAVDRDADALAVRYPDSRTHLIAAAIVRVARFERTDGPPYVGGSLVTIDPRRIQIPAEEAATLPLRGPGDGLRRTPYGISVMYGRRWEPWVVSVDRSPAR